MKKVLFIVLTVFSAIFCNAQDTIASALTMDGDYLIETKVFSDEHGRWFIESVDDNCYTLGTIFIGKDTDEMLNNMEIIRIFLTNNTIKYIEISTSEEYLKMYKSDVEDIILTDTSYKEITEPIPPILTNGTEEFTELPIELVTYIVSEEWIKKEKQ